MKSTPTLLLPLLALCWVPAHAAVISYTDTGTFSSSTPSSAFTAPGETWAVAFQADTSPTVLSFGMGGFSFAFSNFSYSLNGSPVVITPTFIRFFSPGNGGGFEICFNGTTVATCADGLGNGFTATALYTGTTSAPTLLTGAFTADLGFLVNSIAYDQGSNTLNATTAVPESSTLLLTLAVGLLALGGRRLRRRS